MKNIFWLTLIFTSVFLPGSVQAHLEGGVDIIVEQYTVDFGHTPENPQAGETTALAINVIDTTTGQVIDPAFVWLRISGPTGVIFAGNLASELEHVNFSFVFPEAGDYDLTVRFPEITDLEEVTLPLSVIANPDVATLLVDERAVDSGDTTQQASLPDWYMMARSGVTGLLVIAVCLLIVKYYTQKQTRAMEEDKK